MEHGGQYMYLKSQWWSPIVSRHPLDPYSFVHLQTGVILFYICGYPLNHFLDVKPDFESWPLWVGFAILFVLSFIFEIIENARCTIEKYRESSGTSSDYDGMLNLESNMCNVESKILIKLDLE